MFQFVPFKTFINLSEIRPFHIQSLYVLGLRLTFFMSPMNDVCVCMDLPASLCDFCLVQNDARMSIWRIRREKIQFDIWSLALVGCNIFALSHFEIKKPLKTTCLSLVHLFRAIAWMMMFASNENVFDVEAKHTRPTKRWSSTMNPENNQPKNRFNRVLDDGIYLRRKRWTTLE